MKYAVIGAGRQGTAAAYDMARFGNASEVRLLDRDPEVAAAAARRVNELVGRTVATARGIDVEDEAGLAAALSGITAALSGVPYFYNVSVARAALTAGCHFNDLGGNTDVVREELELDPWARKRGVSIVPDCGLAPGMANTLAAWGLSRFERPLAARLYCGGLPQTPRPPLGYRQVFSFEGLANEYTGEAVVLRGGRRVHVPAFSACEAIDIEGIGALEAFYTSGGTSTCPWTFEGKIDTYEYKTLRYPGHFAAMRPLIELGFLDRSPVTVEGRPVSPRAVAEALIAPRIRFPGDPDLVVLRVDVTGETDGVSRTIRMDIIDREDPKTGFTAMERTTAFPAAIVSILQARGEVPPGAIPLELAVPGGPFVAALRERGIPFLERVLDGGPPGPR